MRIENWFLRNEVFLLLFKLDNPAFAQGPRENQSAAVCRRRFLVRYLYEEVVDSQPDRRREKVFDGMDNDIVLGDSRAAAVADYILYY